MNTGSRDEQQFLADVSGIRRALERIADGLDRIADGLERIDKEEEK